MVVVAAVDSGNAYIPIDRKNMTATRQLAIALCIFFCTHTLVHAQPKHEGQRGKLLYETHCNACHTSKIHWREQKLATDWVSLKAEVSRWQASIGLSWSEEEITDVTHYLNAAHYDFPVTEQKGLSQGKKPIHALHQ